MRAMPQRCSVCRCLELWSSPPAPSPSLLSPSLSGYIPPPPGNITTNIQRITAALNHHHRYSLSHTKKKGKKPCLTGKSWQQHSLSWCGYRGVGYRGVYQDYKKSQDRIWGFSSDVGGRCEAHTEKERERIFPVFSMTLTFYTGCCSHLVSFMCFHTGLIKLKTFPIKLRHMHCQQQEESWTAVERRHCIFHFNDTFYFCCMLEKKLRLRIKINRLNSNTSTTPTVRLRLSKPKLKFGVICKYPGKILSETQGGKGGKNIFR